VKRTKLAGIRTHSTTTAQLHQSRTGRNVAIIVGIVVVILIAAYILFDTNIGGGIAYHNVAVSGSISTVGVGTTPIRVDFTSPNGVTTSATVTNGYYSVTLTNNQDYTVTVDWSGLIGSSGSCNGGSLNLNANSGSYSYSTTC
jgi:hypothetical protein